ncbi:MAG: ferritin-like domain-containing protein [Gammaproteobacteria bacterium]
MAGQSAGTHEPMEMMRAETVDLHRGIVSLMEELEAFDWYNQRIDAASDEALKRILAHNRDEEVEHAAMLLEWVRRRNPVFDRMLRAYLFTSKELTEIEVTETSRDGGPVAAAESVMFPAELTVGSLIK